MDMTFPDSRIQSGAQKVQEGARQIKDAALDSAVQLKDSAVQAGSELADAVKQCCGNTEAQIRARPFQSLILACGVGAVIGALLMRVSR
jgi:ElaB/YqjD/DUF883 family membrane-anchored ribosome-binding protein